MQVFDKSSMTGKQFGRWTVLDKYEITPKGERKWLCRCECGTTRYVLERSLLYGGSASCGCLRKERAEKAISPDLTGQTFGELTVIKKLENNGKRVGAWWLCKCSCGEEYEVPGTLLVTGRRTRCSGNAHKKNYDFVDITGKKFGHLTAQYPLQGQRGRRSVSWHCRCDCGSEIDVSYNTLLYTNLKSCGCQKKKHDQELREYLTHVDGTSLDMIRSKKVPSDNTTGYRGVYLIRGKYQAKIVFQHKVYYLGVYSKIEDAAQARKEAEEVLFDNSAQFYAQWEARAKSDPAWAKLNPVQIIVTQDDKKHLSVMFLPDLSEEETVKGCVEQTAL